MSVAVFTKIVLFAMAFYAIFLYTNRQATWASHGNLYLHNRKLPIFVQVVYLVFVTAYFLDECPKFKRLISPYYQNAQNIPKYYHSVSYKNILC